jgi:L-histidine N-alpha-methyltransferase
MNDFACRDLIELGSGATVKVRILLDAAGKHSRGSMRYIPVDISESAITGACDDLLALYPELHVLGIVADFTQQMDAIPIEHPSMICFLGGTIGNMDPEESTAFLRGISQNLKPGDRVMVGFDMVKDRCLMEAAYNDSRGITARFNKNILGVLNHQLEADFDDGDFDHLAFFNGAESRIEMHLVANKDVHVRIQSIGLEIEMERGETIHTENSRKFTKESIEDMAGQAGLAIQSWHSDGDGWFRLVIMRPDGS